MKRISIALCLVAVFTFGCSPMRYSQYSGTSRNWPTTTGAMAENAYAVPVYRSWPDRPYHVLGSLRFEDARKHWDEGILRMAARDAKRLKGDAVIIRVGSEFGVGAIAGAATDSRIFSVGQTTALVIKWKTPEEIAVEAAARRQFVQQILQRHPKFAGKEDIASLVADYVSSHGVAYDSGAARTIAEECVEALGVGQNGSSMWIVKGSVRATSLTSSASDTLYGIAQVNVRGNNITIVSKRGAEISFSGTVTDGRLVGQLGVSSGSTIVSAKAEGVYTEERISLTGSTHTADGTFQGSFVLSR